MAKISPSEQLRRWRGDRSYREAAAILKCSAPFVHRLETGEKRPGAQLARRIERIAGVAVLDWLLARHEAELARLERVRGAR